MPIPIVEQQHNLGFEVGRAMASGEYTHADTVSILGVAANSLLVEPQTVPAFVRLIVEHDDDKRANDPKDGFFRAATRVFADTAVRRRQVEGEADLATGTVGILRAMISGAASNGAREHVMVRDVRGVLKSGIVPAEYMRSDQGAIYFLNYLTLVMRHGKFSRGATFIDDLGRNGAVAPRAIGVFPRHIN